MIVDRLTPTNKKKNFASKSDYKTTPAVTITTSVYKVGRNNIYTVIATCAC